MAIGGTRKILASGLLVVSALALAGCDMGRARLGASDSLTTASTGPVSIKETAEVGRRWEAEPGNVGLGMAYASRLKALGQSERQLQVLATVSGHNPGDASLLSFYGKELAQAGRPAEAAAALEKAIATGKADWRTYSALGSTLDQQTRHADAREHYKKALTLQPDEISVLNNMGMSFALEGNLHMAEETLRKAHGLPAGQKNPRVRQNLALVVGLGGRYDEARQIASQDLPPAEVEANMAYLQRMMAQQDPWQKLKTDSAG